MLVYNDRTIVQYYAAMVVGLHGQACTTFSRGGQIQILKSVQ